jgi:hypothetical protein
MADRTIGTAERWADGKRVTVQSLSSAAERADELYAGFLATFQEQCEAEVIGDALRDLFVFIGSSSPLEDRSYASYAVIALSADRERYGDETEEQFDLNAKKTAKRHATVVRSIISYKTVIEAFSKIEDELEEDIGEAS